MASTMQTGGRLLGKYALITGAAGGIGLATCIKFLQEGVAGLSVIDFNDKALQEAESILKPLAESTGAVLIFVKANVASEEDTANYVKKSLDAFGGRLDISIQNAGLSAKMEPWEETDIANYNRQMEVNTLGPWLGIKHSAPAMLLTPAQRSPNLPQASYPPNKAIVVISSVAALYGQFQASPYNASKWAARGLSITAANEYGPQGIRCNSVHPGPVDTPMLSALFHNPAILKSVVDPIPLRRIAQPEEIANVICFLASDESSYMNGGVIPVHGGQMPL